MTTTETATLTREQAEEITYRIQETAGQLGDLVEQAWKGRAWVALEYASWDEYCRDEFDTGRIKIPLEEREQVVDRLLREGMSSRAIASATGMGGLSVAARRIALRRATGAPDSVATSGKTYPARRQAVGCFDCGATITGPVFYNDDRPYCNDCDTLINPDPVITGVIDYPDADEAIREDMQALVTTVSGAQTTVIEAGATFVGRDPAPNDGEKELMRTALNGLGTAVNGLLRSLDLP